jgi:hypothetical protein
MAEDFAFAEQDRESHVDRAAGREASGHGETMRAIKKSVRWHLKQHYSASWKKANIRHRQDSLN